MRNVSPSLGEAALDLITELRGGDLLGTVTPDRLAEAVGYAASSVRYQLAQQAQARGTGAGSRWSFDREMLFSLALEAALGAEPEAGSAARATASARADTTEPGDLAAALLGSLTRATRRLAARDDRATRAWLLALAVSGTHAGAGDDGAGAGDDHDRADGPRRLLARACARSREAAIPLVEQALAAAGRAPRPGTSVEPLAGQLLALLDGAVLAARAGAPTPPEELLRSVTGLIVAWTAPAGGDGTPDPLLAGLA